MKSYPFTAYEKRVLRACGVSANDLVYHGNTCYGASYSLLNSWFYISGVYCGYDRREIYRDLARKFIERAERAAGY